jgi:hypothetical protein
MQIHPLDISLMLYLLKFKMFSKCALVHFQLSFALRLLCWLAYDAPASPRNGLGCDLQLGIKQKPRL